VVISRARQQQQREKQHNNLNPFESMHINLKRSKVPLVLVGPALLRAFKKDDEGGGRNTPQFISELTISSIFFLRY
jgi:hypothetical protein